MVYHLRRSQQEQDRFVAETSGSAKTKGANTPEFTVSELSGAIKRALENGFGYVRLRGEVSGFRGPHASGHCYFGLKDDKAKIDAVVWRGVWGRLKMRPEEGMEVIATGKISSFPGSSKYQIVIDTLEPAGIGALMAQLEERKKKLAALGLFDDDRKSPLPYLPKVVGIITSPTGAVIRDMLAGFAERFPTHVIVWPVRVQGETSSQEVAAAIRGFNAIAAGGVIARPDVLIVARGGGSLEDLWGFNDEIVVRAVADSALPVISAVGHETDWTLIDLVADARAPTPTKAAEWAVPKHSDLSELTGKLGLRLGVGARRVVDSHARELRAAARGLPRPDDLVALPRQRLDASANRLQTGLAGLVQKRQTNFALIAGRLPSLKGLVVAPRQRFDAVERRLGRALHGNTQAHHTRQAKVAARFGPHLLENRLARMQDRLDALFNRNGQALARAASARRARFERVAGRLQPSSAAHRIDRLAERLSALDGRRRQGLATAMGQRRRVLDGAGKLLGSYSYQSVLARGFALVRDAAGQAVRRSEGIGVGQVLDIEFADGRVSAAVSETGQTRARVPSKSASDKPASTSKSKSSGGPGQGSLF
jgi:exodeoxyribonuclease VII large subunit